jgi:hypothetical protein
VRIVIILWAAGTASAQFSGLSTTNDGSRVYFSSSLPQRDTSQNFSSKIFMIDSAGLHLVASVPGPGDFYSPVLSFPQVSGDGTLLSYL